MTIEKPTPDAVECRELRTYQSKTFRLPCGSMQCEVRRDAVCYTSDDGVLRSCDTTIKQAEGRVFVEWLPYKFELHKSGVGFDFQSRGSGFVRLTLTGIGGDDFNVSDTLKPTIVANDITFEEVSPGVDIVLRILPNRVKTLRIVKTPDAAKTFEWLCEHDADGRDKVDGTLTGNDANGVRLDLASATIPVNEVSFRLTEAWSGKTVVRDPETRIKSLSSEVAYPVEIDPTVSYSVAADANDGWENHTGTFSATGNIYFGKTGGNYYSGGWQFGAVNVPQGATITSATMTIVVMNSNVVTGKLYAELADNPVMFSTSHRPTQVARTTAFGSMSTSIGSKVFTITSVVQEVVSQAWWAANEHLNLMAIGTAGGYVRLTPYSTSPTDSAQLSITYTVAAANGNRNLLLMGCG